MLEICVALNRSFSCEALNLSGNYMRGPKLHTGTQNCNKNVVIFARYVVSAPLCSFEGLFEGLFLSVPASTMKKRASFKLCDRHPINAPAMYRDHQTSDQHTRTTRSTRPRFSKHPLKQAHRRRDIFQRGVQPAQPCVTHSRQQRGQPQKSPRWHASPRDGPVLGTSLRNGHNVS